MKNTNLKSLLAVGALAFSCTAAQALPVVTPVVSLVTTVLGGTGQNLAPGALAGGGITPGVGALAANLPGLGAGSLNSLIATGASTSTSTIALQGVGAIGGGLVTVNVLNGSTVLPGVGTGAGVP